MRIVLSPLSCRSDHIPLSIDRAKQESADDRRLGAARLGAGRSAVTFGKGRDGTEYVQLCGEINAKNGYGGMSGFHKFMLIGDQVLIGGAGQIVNADEICGNGRGIVDTRDYTPELRKAFDASAGG